VATFEKEILAGLYEQFPSSRLLASRLKVSHTTVATKLRKHGIGTGIPRVTTHKFPPADDVPLSVWRQ
jgi:TyrR family helix-turn-helix protein